MKKNIIKIIAIFILFFSSLSFGQDIIAKKVLDSQTWYAQLTADDSKLFILDGKGVEIIDVKTMSIVSNYFYDSHCYSFCISPDGKYLAIGKPSHVGVWNIEKKTLLCDVKVSSPFRPGGDDDVAAMYITNVGKFVVYRTGMNIIGVLNVENQNFNDLFSNEEQECLKGFPLDNNKIITSDDSGNILITNVGKDIKFSKKMLNEQKRLYIISTLGNNLVTFSFKDIYQLWNNSFEDWKLIKQINKDYQRNPIYFSNKIIYSKCNVVSSPDENFPRELYDFNTGNVIYSFSMNDCKRDDGSIAPDIYVKPIENDNKLLVVRNHEIRIYDISKLTSGATNTELNK